MIEDGYSVELRFVSGRPIGGNDRLETIVEAANTGFDDANQKITFELYGSAELLLLDKEFAAAATGAPVGTVTFSIQEKKLLRWEITDSDAPRDTIVGLIKGNELSALYGEYGNKLFASNIRLPLITKKVNPEIRKTADEAPEDFFYYNNGVSAVCKRYEIIGTTVTAHGFQVINGAQTVDALRKALRKKPDCNVYVLFRLTASESYGADKNFVQNVIRFNNTQNPVKRLFDFDRAISMKSGLRPAVCGCSGIVSGGPSCLDFGSRRRRV
jgi:AIPR protein